jgi:hypothetical protein
VSNDTRNFIVILAIFFGAVVVFTLFMVAEKRCRHAGGTLVQGQRVQLVPLEPGEERVGERDPR